MKDHYKCVKPCETPGEDHSLVGLCFVPPTKRPPNEWSNKYGGTKKINIYI